jgi:hypothetical protein
LLLLPHSIHLYTFLFLFLYDKFFFVLFSFFFDFFFSPSFSHLVWFYVSSIPRAFSYALKPAAAGAAGAAEAVEPTAEQQQHFSS